MSTIDFKEAIKVEADALDLEALMQSILESEEGEKQPDYRLDDLTLRRYLIAAHKIKQEEAQLKEYKKAVVAQWDDMISKKKAESDKIDAVIKAELEKRKRETPSFKNVKFDIGTISYIEGSKDLKMTSAEDLEVDAMMLGKLEEYQVKQFDSARLFQELKEKYAETGTIPEGFHVGVKEVEKPASTRFTNRMK